MDDDKHTIRLSTGKEIYAHRGIVGISPDLREVTEGYDGGIERGYETEEDWGDSRYRLTPAERVEIADLMLARWRAYRERWSQ
jgi:hypothetical protein